MSVTGFIMEITKPSLSNIIRTRPARRILASDFISFFGGRQPTCIIQFCLMQKSPPAGSEISECI